MPQQKSKKILIYFFLFLIIGSLNNKYINNFDLPKIHQIEINGLDKNNNLELAIKLKNMKLGNLFFIEKANIIKIINSNELVEKYSVFKKYPSSLKIDIIKTDFLAYIKKDNKNFLLGSNGKLIKSREINKNLPYIFGDFNNSDFFNLKKNIDESNFKFEEVKNLFYFKSGRWDIETFSGLIVKLPKDNVVQSLNLLIDILDKLDSNKISKIDLRQKNQIIINEQ